MHGVVRRPHDCLIYIPSSCRPKNSSASTFASFTEFRYVPPVNIKQLLSYRLNVLANMSSRIAALRNKRRFGLSMLDWRIIGLLACFAPMSLNRLALEANLDKSRASRAISDLISRGLIKRNVDKNDARGIRLELSAKGKSLYRVVLPNAVQRNEELVSVLTDNEKKMLDKVFSKLTQRALIMFTEERKLVKNQKLKAN